MDEDIIMEENKRSEKNITEDADVVLSENNSAESESAAGSVSAKDLLGKLKKNMSGSKKRNKKGVREPSNMSLPNHLVKMMNLIFIR